MKLSSCNYLVKEGLKNIWNNRMMSLASIVVLVSCLIITGSAMLPFDERYKTDRWYRR